MRAKDVLPTSLFDGPPLMAIRPRTTYHVRRNWARQKWVNSTYAACRAAAAEVPPKADEFAAARRTGGRCQGISHTHWHLQGLHHSFSERARASAAACCRVMRRTSGSA